MLLSSSSSSFLLFVYSSKEGAAYINLRGSLTFVVVSGIWVSAIPPAPIFRVVVIQVKGGVKGGATTTEAVTVATRNGAALILAGYNWEVSRGAMLWWWYDWLAERADGCCDFPLVLFSCLRKMAIGRLSGDTRESRVEVVEAEFPRISARGYIINSKVKI